MPFNVGLELMAQAAAPLCSDKVLVAIRRAKAHDWLLFEQPTRPIRLVAHRLSTPGEVHVALSAPASHAKEKDRLIYDAVFCFADTYPLPPAARPVLIEQTTSGPLNLETIYLEHMFHGPTFQSVALLQRCTKHEVQALMGHPAPALLERGIPGRLLTAPQLLDGAGQVVGLWAESQLHEHFVIFPDEVAEITLYRAPDALEPHVFCHMSPDLEGTAFIHSQGVLLSAQGEVLIEVSGLRHRRIFMPELIHRFRQSREVLLSASWSLPLAPYTELNDRLSCGRFNYDLIDLAGGDGQVLLAVIAHIILSRRERELWYSMKAVDKRRKEWLLGRLVAKETVRRLLRMTSGEDPWSADIEILPDYKGRPVVQGPEVPDNYEICLSLSHTEPVAAALAAMLPLGSGVGLDIEQRLQPLDQEFIHLAFSQEERQFLGDQERIIQGWCAKEAVAKALGSGMPSPKEIVITGYDEQRGIFLLQGARGTTKMQQPDVLKLQAFTQQAEELMVAVSVNSGG
jgi:4'-phosphopantetheinyl transferase EntD